MKLKSVTASVLMVSIIGVGTLNLRHLIDTQVEDGLVSSTQIDNYYNDYFSGKFEFVNLYGAIQKLLYKNEVDNFDVVKDEQGKLQFQYFAKEPNDMTDVVKQLDDYAKYLQSLDIDLAFVLSPDKVVEGYTTFSEGLPYSYSNEGADEFLKLLDSKTIEYLDLRMGILDALDNPSNLFFNTDHHWTTQAAFWAFSQVVSYLNGTFEFNLDTGLTDLNLYEMKTYPQIFLGSQGKRTGVIYAGLDDFTTLNPKFETQYTYTWKVKGQEEKVVGSFDETLLQTSWLSDELSIETDRYLTYLGNNYGEATITNHLNEEGIKVLMIKDSYMLPLSAFLSTTVFEIKLVDLRYYEGPNMYELVSEYQPDVVIVSTNPTNLVPEFFRFGGES